LYEFYLFLLRKLSYLLACKLEKERPGGMFDMELEIGEGFAARF